MSRDQALRGGGPYDSRGDSCQRQNNRLAQNQLLDVAQLGSQRDAKANLRRAASDGIGDDAVESKSGQREGKQAEGAGQSRD